MIQTGRVDGIRDQVLLNMFLTGISSVSSYSIIAFISFSFVYLLISLNQISVSFIKSALQQTRPPWFPVKEKLTGLPSLPSSSLNITLAYEESVTIPFL